MDGFKIIQAILSMVIFTFSLWLSVKIVDRNNKKNNLLKSFLCILLIGTLQWIFTLPFLKICLAILFMSLLFIHYKLYIVKSLLAILITFGLALCMALVSFVIFAGLNLIPWHEY